MTPASPGAGERVRSLPGLGAARAAARNAAHRAARAAAFVAAVAFAIGLGAGPSAPSVSAFAAEDDPAVTWAVSPASESGPDGRAWVELSLDPGASAVEHLAVRNLGDAPATFALTAADGYYTESGRFNMLPSDRESEDAGTWIEIASSVDVLPGELVIVPFTIRVPERAIPGDHAAGVAASVSSTGAVDSGAQVSVESRIGFRVMTRVTGVLAPSVALDGVSGSYRMTWNPFSPGAAVISFTAVNSGNTRLALAGTVTVAGREVAFGGDEPDARIELLPGDERALSVVVPNVWPLFLLPSDVRIEAQSETDGSWAPIDAPVTASVSVWAVPWPQGAILLGLALIVGALLFQRRRTRRRTEELIDQARREGRESALAAAGDR